MKYQKLLKYTLITLLAGIILIVLFVTAVNHGVFGHLYSKEEIKSFRNETAALVYSNDNELIGKIFHENRTNVQYDQIPEHLINALVATEDARYFEHEGVDSRSLLRVLFKTILMNDKRSGGGSTITQQLAKNMYGRKNFGPLTILVNKTKEGLLAHRIEDLFSKEEILALYLNTVPFGENVYGIEAASLRFYSKNVEELSIEESAVLVGMLKANTYYNPRLHPDHAFDRRNVVLSQMEKYEYITETEKDSLSSLELKINYADLGSEGRANYFLFHLKKRAQKIIDEYNYKHGTEISLESDGLIIHSTLNAALQDAGLKAFQQHLSRMQTLLSKEYNTSVELESMALSELDKMGISRRKDEAQKRLLFSWKGMYSDSVTALDSIKHSLQLLHAGMIAIKPEDGSVLSWIGGIDYQNYPYDQVLAKRQMASSFKPILYTAAVEDGIAPCDYLENDPLILEDHDDWKPQNYDKSDGGKYSMAGALSKSLNIPTVNLYFDLGYDELDYLWKKMGFTCELNNSPSTALGTGEASLMEAALAYAVLANGGKKVDLSMIQSIQTSDGNYIYRREAEEGKEIIHTRSAAIINAILQRAINEGTGVAMRSSFGVDMPLAGKTGTSQNYADAWFIAYNPEMVIATRVGASSPAIHFASGSNGSGSRLALPLVGYTLAEAQKSLAVKKEISSSFPPMEDRWIAELDCPDFKEDSGLEKFMDRFKKEESNEKKKKRKADRKKRRRDRKKKKKDQ